MTIHGTTQLLGLIGYPVEHSLSPAMHNAAIAQLGADYVYVPFPVAPEDLPQAVAGLWALGVQGFNLTIPHKQAVVPLLHDIMPEAKAVGAVNTVYRIKSGWIGTNTDVLGFMAPLQGRSWDGATAVVLGCGGAARAVVAGCDRLGFQQIQMIGRSPDKLQTFQESWKLLPLNATLSVHSWDTLIHQLPQAQLVVNATPLGMSPKVDASPLDASALDCLAPGTTVYDLIYVPSPTRLLKDAQSRGAIALDGLEMLVQQGAAALELWTQQTAPVDVMRETLKRSLGLT
jgi:shikimate dehydrogenase